MITTESFPQYANCYSDINEWDKDRLEQELLNLSNDHAHDLLSNEVYHECYDIVLGELLNRKYGHTSSDPIEAYERAMKGI